LFTEPQQHLFVASSFDTYKDVLDQCLETYGSAVPGRSLRSAMNAGFSARRPLR
jgi:hypothetical protein